MARRRFQNGCVILRGDVWYGKYRVDEQVRGKVIRKQKFVPLGTKREYPTKNLAKRQLQTLLNPINSVHYRPGRSATIGEFSVQWDAQIVSHWKPSAAGCARSHLNKHINPVLGHLPIQDFDVQAQQEFVTGLRDRVSSKTLRNVLGTLSSMLRTAKKWGYTTETFSLTNLTLPEWRKGSGRTFTPEQARQILAVSPQPWKLMFSLAAFLGLRAGEILGLRGEDIDWNSRVLWIRQTAWYGEIQTSKSSGSDDSLPIPETLFEMLLKHGVRSGLLFINKRKRPYTAEKVVQRQLWPICDRFEIPRAGFHAFRHLHTSLLLAIGATPKVAQRQLRHSDPRITLDLYAHVIGDEQRKAVESAADLLSGIKLVDKTPVVIDYKHLN